MRQQGHAPAYPLHETANLSLNALVYSHLEYNAKVNSAETIARVLGGDPAPKSEPDKTAEKKTATKKSTAKTASDTAPKKTRGRKKKSDNPEGTGESQRSTL